MIEITEEPYDGPIAEAFVRALLEDLNVRYAEVDAEVEEAPTDDDYLAEVTPEQVRPPKGTFLVAWIDGAPAGCGALKPLGGDPSVAEVKRMYTAPAARRRGVSRAILARLEQAAATLGYGRIQLETGTEQPEAMQLYESHGYHRIERYGQYKDYPTSACFAKELEAR